MARRADKTSAQPGRVRTELDKLDVAVYAAIARTRTPRLDRAFSRLSQAADLSKLWLGSAAVLALAGGSQGRRAAVNGVASLGLTSLIVNVVLKPLFGRRRPERVVDRLPVARRVRMPRTRSFPSGHSASGFAFATGVASAAPMPGAALTFLAALVAYSRVHTGVHYPGDVLAGSTLGVALAPVAVAAVDRCRSRQPDPHATRAD
jgi:membrane-associated phospholipid phosphatase